MERKLEKPKQNMRYSDEEMGLIKNTFAEQDELLIALRKLFLQFDLTDKDIELLRLIKKPNTLKLLRKTFLPELEPDAPLTQLVDLWMTLSIADKSLSDAKVLMTARETLIKYLDQNLQRLDGKKPAKMIMFNDLIPNKDKTEWDAYSDLVARNTLINHIDMQLNVLKILAGLKEETIEQTKERLSRDSNK